MSMFGKKLAIQSWTLRGIKTNEGVIKAVKECGLDKIEMCGIHVDPVTLQDGGASALKLYEQSGVTMSAFGVHGFGADEASARKVFEFAKMAGFPTISADLAAVPEALPLVEKLCEEYGKKIAIHNHGRHHRLGSVWALEDLFKRSSQNVGLWLDTAWALDSGINPVEMVRTFAYRLYGMHIKDFVFNKAGKPEDVVVGTGNLDMKALFNVLTGFGYNGAITLEYEGDVANPLPAVKQCVQAIRAVTG